MKVEGFFIIFFIILSFFFNQKFVVVDIGIDGIFGFDFMINNECFVDVYNVLMIVKGKQIKFFFEGKLGCCRIIVVENVMIFLCSELIIMCNVKFFVFEKVLLFGIVELLDCFLELD